MKLFELQDQYVRKLIRDTIETYSGAWRLVHEAIQNSHDAIQLREGLDRGEIVVDLHMGTNQVSVQDNGVGIPVEQFPTMFTLGGTVKGDHELRRLLKGSQGVGIKATVFTSDYFEVETVSGGAMWSKRIDDAWRFDQPEFDDRVEEPNVVSSGSEVDGTRVSYRLHDYSVRDFFAEITEEACNELGVGEIASEAELLNLVELYTRTQTYLGCTHALLGLTEGLKPINVKVNLRLDYPSLAAHRECDVPKCPWLPTEEYHARTLTRDFPAKYYEVEEVHAALARGQRADRMFTNFEEVVENPPDRALKKFLVQKMRDTQARRLLCKVGRDTATSRPTLVENAEILAKHARLLEKLNGVYLIVGPRGYLTRFLKLSPRQVLSVNGLPTNISLNPPRGAGALGYLLNIHLVVDLDTTLGYGKRNVPGVTKGQVDAFFADAYPMLRRVARAIVGETEERDPVGDLWDKEAEYEAYMRVDNPFRNLDVPLRLPPVEEQDVICLFHELIAKGELAGYYPFRSSSIRTYDSLVYISPAADRAMPSDIGWRDLKTVEFKTRLSALIQDFRSQAKFIPEIDLAVVWEDDCGDETEYIISSLDRDGVEPLPGAQKRIRRGNETCQVLVLKELPFAQGTA